MIGWRVSDPNLNNPARDLALYHAQDAMDCVFNNTSVKISKIMQN